MKGGMPIVRNAVCGVHGYYVGAACYACCVGVPATPPADEWHPAPVRLTVEESMYWMGRMLAHARQYGSEESYLECAAMVASAGMGDVEGLHRAASMGLEDIEFARRFGGGERPLERFGRMKWWLCRQAIAAIGREQGR